jgi:DNA mismatch repair protein MutL
LADYLKSVDPTQGRIRFTPPAFPSQNVRPSISSTFDRPFPASDKPPDVPEQPHACDQPAGDIDDRASDTADIRDAVLDEVAGGSIIQIHNTYLVAQTDEGIIIVDQHALHERILYEQFRSRILSGPLESQRLLIPQTLEVSAEQAEAAAGQQALLERLGIELTQFGPNVLAVQSFPAMLPNLDVCAFVGDLLDRLAEEDGSDSEELHLHKALDMMACKAAVKAGDVLTEEEMRALLAQRELVERSSNCPHGRPTTLQLSTQDLDRQFKRG